VTQETGGVIAGNVDATAPTISIASRHNDGNVDATAPTSSTASRHNDF
jgi:hypothetical protein